MLWLAFMVCFTGWAGFSFFNTSSQIADKSAKLTEVKGTQAEKEQTLEELKQEVNRLQDPEYIGQIARKKYGMYLPGETPIYSSDE